MATEFAATERRRSRRLIFVLARPLNFLSSDHALFASCANIWPSDGPDREPPYYSTFREFNLSIHAPRCRSRQLILFSFGDLVALAMER